MSKLRSLWQKIHHRPFIVLGCIGVFVVLIALTYGVIRFGWGWTGFTGGYSQETVKGTTEDKVYLSSKTLWDWMHLLLVPIMLAIGGFWLNQLQKRREERTAAQRNETDHEIAADNQREAALQAYIDKIGELLLREHEHLGESPGNPQVENIARARTVTVLRILDPARRASLLRFLSQAGILQLCTEGNLVGTDLHGTNLSRVDLSNLNLTDANLRGANLTKAVLRGANLTKAVLSDADLTDANLRGANLTRADLSGAYLFGTVLSDAKLTNAALINAKLINADLSGAYLFGAVLSGVYLVRTDFREVYLVRADLSGVDLSDANLSGANLRYAKGLTDEQRVNYQSRGARVDPISSAPPVQSTVPPATSSTPQSDNSQDQSVPPVQAGGTSSSAGNTAPPIQGEGVDGSSTSPAQSDALP
jgi:uncharacterized protein YjbI with pentapeptide repeats